jgi:hypothetical protein
MKKYLSFIILTLFIYSCEKSTSVSPSKSISGLWVGTSSSPTVSSRPMTWSIEPDGTLTWNSQWSGDTFQFGTGEWVLSGTTLICDLETVYGYPGTVGTTQRFTATFNPRLGKLTSGTWSNTNINNMSGTFELTKVE